MEMPISHPKPNSPPSVNRVDALTYTAALSTLAVKYRYASGLRVTMASLWPVECDAMWATASFTSSTHLTARM